MRIRGKRRSFWDKLFTELHNFLEMYNPARRCETSDTSSTALSAFLREFRIRKKAEKSWRASIFRHVTLARLNAEETDRRSRSWCIARCSRSQLVSPCHSRARALLLARLRSVSVALLALPAPAGFAARARLYSGKMYIHSKRAYARN